MVVDTHVMFSFMPVVPSQILPLSEIREAILCFRRTSCFLHSISWVAGRMWIHAGYIFVMLCNIRVLWGGNIILRYCLKGCMKKCVCNFVFYAVIRLSTPAVHVSPSRFYSPQSTESRYTCLDPFKAVPSQCRSRVRPYQAASKSNGKLIAPPRWF